MASTFSSKIYGVRGCKHVRVDLQEIVVEEDLVRELCTNSDAVLQTHDVYYHGDIGTCNYLRPIQDILKELKRPGGVQREVLLHAKLKRPANVRSRQPDEQSQEAYVQFPSFDGPADERPGYGYRSRREDSEEYDTQPESEPEEGYVVLRKDGKEKHEVTVLLEDFEIVRTDESHLASSPMRDDFVFTPSLGGKPNVSSDSSSTGHAEKTSKQEESKESRKQQSDSKGESSAKQEKASQARRPAQKKSGK